jgi:hypothetical protein
MNQITLAQKSYTFDHPADEKFKSKAVELVKTESQKDMRIKAEIDQLQQWEKHVKQHEFNHAVVGGSDVGSISYVYTYGPDGKKYIAGGQVSVKIPGGLNEKSMASLDKLKKATNVSHDMSMKDSIAAGVISAIQKSRQQKIVLKEAIDKYEKNMQDHAREKIKSGEEIFQYKKMEVSSTSLLELFV